MSPGTRGPKTGKVPPHVQGRLEAKHERRRRRELLGPWYRRNPFVAAVAALLALIGGIVLGRVTAPDPVGAALDEAELALTQADTVQVIWDIGTIQGGAPVEQALNQLEEGDPTLVETNLQDWVAAIDGVVSTLETTELDAPADGVRRLALTSAELALDAIETLGAAATVDGEARELLITEARRLKARSDGANTSARALLLQLQGSDQELPAEPSPGPTLPAPSAPAGTATDDPVLPGETETPDTGESPAGTETATEPEPTPTAS